MISREPLVSVVIPVFEGARFLPDAIRSIRQQTYSNIEIIVVDGGSSASSLEKIKNLVGDVERFESLPPGTPVEKTWTRCCELATGDFVKLLCQDDIIYPHAISVQLGALINSPESSLVFSKRDIIDAHGNVVAGTRGGLKLGSRTLTGEEALLSGYRAGSNIFGEPLAVLFRRESLAANLPWDASIPYLIDMSMYAACMWNQTVIYLDEVVGAFRVSSQSWSTRMTAEQTHQFREWQGRVEHGLEDVSKFHRLQALTNAHRVSWTRSAAYVWLRVTGRL